MFSADDSVIASIDSSANLIYHYMDESSPMLQNLNQDGLETATAFAFNDGANHLVYASPQQDGTGCVLKVFSPVENEPVRDLSCEGKPGTVVAVSPNGKFAALGTQTNVVTLWDITTGNVMHVKETGGTIYSLAFDPQSRLLVSSGCAHKDTPCTQGEIVIWDVRTGTEKMNLSGHLDAIRSIAFSPDGKKIASGGRDGIVLLWNAKTGNQIGAQLDGHASSVNALAFSPDGKILASAGSDLQIILWDVQGQQRIGKALAGHTSSIGTLTFSHDGNSLVSGDNKGNIFLWEIAPDALADRLCERVGRNFTHEEWIQYFPDEEYRKTCDQWP